MDFLIELVKKDPSEVAGGVRESNEETIMFALNMVHTGGCERVWAGEGWFTYLEIAWNNNKQ